MADMKVNFAGVEFKNPIITASGTFGFGREYAELYPLEALGGVASKGITLHARKGNDSPRIAETPAGMLNSVGLQNPGVDRVAKFDLPWLLSQNTRVIANIAGSKIEDYCAVAERISETGVDMIELNISCPNVKQGGVAFGVSTEAAAGITKEVRKYCKKPLMVKLSPNAASIADIAAAVESEGADAVSLINTLTGMRININNRRPILKNNIGGLSGPAVFPVAVRMVWEVSKRVKIPVMGMGGISKWQDVVEMMLAGAAAVQVGTVNFTDPLAPLSIIEGLEKYLDESGIGSVSELTGKAQIWE